MEWHREFSILMIDDELRADNAEGRALRSIVSELEKLGFSVLEALSLEDGKMMFLSQADIGCVLLDWDICKPEDGSTDQEIIGFIREMKTRNRRVPIFLFTERLDVERIPLEVLRLLSGYFWVTEDTADFIGGRIEIALEEYVDHILPPFFRRLVEYTYQFKYTWHTPGHGGGVAFLKSPSGRLFHKFFGENTLRSDLSVSVPELGSLMEHSDVLGLAEQNAAKAFGADRTYFVTNGTSTANKMVFQGRVTPGDVVLVDRNCHKSALHSLILTRAMPVYFIPTRNEQGIIGPIHPEEFQAKTIKAKLEAHPLIDESEGIQIRHAIVTNSTYDGLCYHAGMVLEDLKGIAQSVHFDEAWYAYACFHHMYDNRHAMYQHALGPDNPAVFATQSTHKLLAAFSQASMVHVKDSHVQDPARQVPHDRFNEAFMMHTSTSPQYGIIASLDVATRMMQDGRGRQLITDTIQEAVHFRKKLAQLGDEIANSTSDPNEKWWFSPWQPESFDGRKFSDLEDDYLSDNSGPWTLKPGDTWHGFEGLGEDYCMLDPIKVTVVSPGIETGGKMADHGIPAGLVSRFLRNQRIVVEKTQFYSFLLLFSMGSTKGKSGSLLAQLFEFKRLYDTNAPAHDVFPHLLEEHAAAYEGMGLRDLSNAMHGYLKDNHISEVVKESFSYLPPPVMTPAEAYDRLVKGDVEELRLDDLEDRIAAVMVVPYPPGIPMIMPGERFSADAKALVDYLRILEKFDRAFPGFETEIHGVNPKTEDSKLWYYISCVK